jgi:small subunit ribosomal protein S7
MCKILQPAFIKKSAFKDNRIASYFQDLNISHFINVRLKKGKKAKSEKVMKKMTEELASIYLVGYRRILDVAISQIRPIVEVKQVKRFAQQFNIPIPLKKHRSVTFATRWIFEGATANSQKSFIKNILEVIDNILYKRGPVFKKKAELYKLAELNRVYSYFRW